MINKDIMMTVATKARTTLEADIVCLIAFTQTENDFRYNVSWPNFDPRMESSETISRVVTALLEIAQAANEQACNNKVAPKILVEFPNGDVFPVASLPDSDQDFIPMAGV